MWVEVGGLFVQCERVVIEVVRLRMRISQELKKTTCTVTRLHTPQAENHLWLLKKRGVGSVGERSVGVPATCHPGLRSRGSKRN